MLPDAAAALANPKLIEDEGLLPLRAIKMGCYLLGRTPARLSAHHGSEMHEDLDL